MQKPYTCKQEDPLPNGSLYLPKQPNTLSRSPCTSLLPKVYNNWVLLIVILCRPFHSPRKAVLLSNLGEVPLSRWNSDVILSFLMFFLIPLFFQSNKERKVVNLILVLCLLQWIWYCCGCCVCGGGFYCSPPKETVGVCDRWLHFWVTVRRIIQFFTCHQLLLTIHWWWFIYPSQL